MTSRNNFSTTNIQNFIQKLNDINWEVVIHLENVDEAYNVFFDCVLKLHEKHFPQRKLNTRVNINKSPWLTDQIYNSITSNK